LNELNEVNFMTS